MERKAVRPPALDLELLDLPPEDRWREWMGRIEAVIFAACAPVPRAVLASVVGKSANLDLLLEDIQQDLRHRPYQIVAVAGGWQFRTRPKMAPVIHQAGVVDRPQAALGRDDLAVLLTIAYLQPITRAELGSVLGKEVSREIIGRLRNAQFVAPGPRSPSPGAPYTYITTLEFLTQWGLNTLQDLPDLEQLRDAGLLSKRDVLARLGAP
jgi:segregation and condensation protein B